MRLAVLGWIGIASLGCATTESRECYLNAECPSGRCDPVAGVCLPPADDGGTDLPAEDTPPPTCTPDTCAASCRAAGYPDGACLGASCQCVGDPSDAPDADPDSDPPPDVPAGCTPDSCTAECAAFGLLGTCRGRDCECSSPPDAADSDDAGPPDDGPAPDDTPAEDIGPEDATPEDAPPEDTGPPTGPCGGPFVGSGYGGDSGWYCLDEYTFRTIAGNSYTISTCSSYSGDPYLVVSGSCSCSSDDACGLASECTCTATSSGTATICASSYGYSDASWSYTVTGICGL